MGFVIKKTIGLFLSNEFSKAALRNNTLSYKMFLSHVSRASNKIHRLVALVKVSEAGEALKLKMEI